MGWSAENIEERRKKNRWKTLKIQEKGKWRLRGKSNNNNIHLQFLIIFSSKTWFEKKLFVPSNFVLVAGYLKHSSDTPNPNIHKYTNYNIIQIYINRLSTTTQISIAMDYLIMMSEKCIYFRKRKKHAARSFFTHPIEKTGSMYFKNIFWIISLPKICTKIQNKLE